MLVIHSNMEVSFDFSYDYDRFLRFSCGNVRPYFQGLQSARANITPLCQSSAIRYEMRRIAHELHRFPTDHTRNEKDQLTAGSRINAINDHFWTDSDPGSKLSGLGSSYLY